MSDQEDKPHPLYPKIQEQKRYSLYPPKQCLKCEKTSFDVDWREVTFTESTSWYFGVGHTTTMRTELLKWCKDCFDSHNRVSSWS